MVMYMLCVVKRMQAPFRNILLLAIRQCCSSFQLLVNSVSNELIKPERSWVMLKFSLSSEPRMLLCGESSVLHADCWTASSRMNTKHSVDYPFWRLIYSAWKSSVRIKCSRPQRTLSLADQRPFHLESSFFNFSNNLPAPVTFFYNCQRLSCWSGTFHLNHLFCVRALRWASVSAVFRSPPHQLLSIDHPECWE